MVACNYAREYEDAPFIDGEEALALPTDDSALKHAIDIAYCNGVDAGTKDCANSIKQAKREALLEAADMLVQQSRHEASYELRRMAEEIAK